MTREEFLAEIDSFLKTHGMNATRFGRLALNDTNFVHRIRGGADVRLNTMSKVREFMRLENESLKTNASAA